MSRYVAFAAVLLLVSTALARAETRIEITRGNAVRTAHTLFGEAYRTITTPSGDTYLEPGSYMERLAVAGMRTGIFGARFGDPPPCPDGKPKRVLTGFRGFSCAPDRPQAPAVPVIIQTTEAARSR